MSFLAIDALFSTLSIQPNQWDAITDDYLRADSINNTFESKFSSPLCCRMTVINMLSAEYQARVKKLLQHHAREDDLTDDLLDLFEKLILLVC